MSQSNESHSDEGKKIFSGRSRKKASLYFILSILMHYIFSRLLKKKSEVKKFLIGPERAEIYLYDVYYIHRYIQ